MVALYIIVIIYFNSYRVFGEEVKGNEEIGGSKEEMNRNVEEIEKSEEDRLLIEIIPDLYRSYRDVLRNSNETKSLRRIFKNNKEYQIHVEKLKGVNGFKKHNLIIRSSSKTNPIIYVDNPVETKIPNAYLTLQDFKSMLTERIRKQKEEFKNDYLEPKLHKNKHVPGKAKNIGISKLKRKKTTLNRTHKFRTESSKNISNTKAILIQNLEVKTKHKTVQNTAVKEKENDKTKLQENKNSETEIVINDPENAIKNNSRDTTKSKKVFGAKSDGNKPLEDEIAKKSLVNVTEKNLDTVTTEAIEVNLKVSKRNISELNKINQNNENVENTSENVTEKIATEFKDTQTNEQNISKIEETSPIGDKIEENTTIGTTEDTTEVITEQIEENTSDTEVVTEETTSTTVQTTRTRLSKPLVWMGER